MRVKGAFQIGLLGGLGVLLAIAIAGAVGQISSVLVYAFAAIFLALGIDPIVQFLTRHRFPRWLAVLTVIIVILGAFTGIVLIVVPVIVAQFSSLIQGVVAAFQGGLLEDVLDWAQQTFPGIDWERQAAYFFQRVIEHGRRRAEEVREVAETVREAGLQPWSASGTAERQAWVADLADAGLFGARGGPGFARSDDWRTEADRILARLAGERAE